MRQYPLEKMFESCPKCKTDKMIANLEVNYNYDRFANVLTRELLPVKDERFMITSGEGNSSYKM